MLQNVDVEVMANKQSIEGEVFCRFLILFYL